MKFDVKNFVLLEVGEHKEGQAMIQNKIDFEELQEKTSGEFVEKVKHILKFYSLEDDRFLIKDVRDGIKVIFSGIGAITVLEYRFITGHIQEDCLATQDVRLFYDMPFEMKKEVASCQST
ncbi:hypothetical protein K7887_18510 [Sutcliffiella horikoshii]|uniref:hypothetical protein n=1 Tax=Sutcliffiella horikoshii TaxID=79883 RepID=UPI001CBC1467|nr:hypothetical protein [Sutcliffiella horikoshii]UAL46834.1 hypothetical protein K7887_18510 [Sutcliffiella horikoshii]